MKMSRAAGCDEGEMTNTILLKFTQMHVTFLEGKKKVIISLKRKSDRFFTDGLHILGKKSSQYKAVKKYKIHVIKLSFIF